MTTQVHSKPIHTIVNGESVGVLFLNQSGTTVCSLKANDKCSPCSYRTKQQASLVAHSKNFSNPTLGESLRKEKLNFS